MKKFLAFMIVLSGVVPAYGAADAVAAGADARPGLVSLGEEKVDAGVTKITLTKVAFNYRFALMVQNAGLGEIETAFSKQYQDLRTSLRALFVGGLTISADKNAVEKWYDENIRKLTNQIKAGKPLKDLTFEGTAAAEPSDADVRVGAGRTEAGVPPQAAALAPAVGGGMIQPADAPARATTPDSSHRATTPLAVGDDHESDETTTREHEDDLEANASPDAHSGGEVTSVLATEGADEPAEAQGPKITLRLPDDASDDGALSAESPAGSGATDDTFADATTETDDSITGNTTGDDATPEPISPMSGTAGTVSPSSGNAPAEGSDAEEGLDDEASTVSTEVSRDAAAPAASAPLAQAPAAGAGRRVVDLNAPYHVEGQIGRRNQIITREHAAMMRAWHADGRPTGPIFRFMEKAEEAGRLIVRAKTWRGVDDTPQSELFQALAESTVYTAALDELNTSPEQITRYLVGDFIVDRALEKPRTTKAALAKFQQLITEYIHSREGAPKSGAPARSAE